LQLPPRRLAVVDRATMVEAAHVHGGAGPPLALQGLFAPASYPGSSAAHAAPFAVGSPLVSIRAAGSGGGGTRPPWPDGSVGH
jgi:hypothetical protein